MNNNKILLVEDEPDIIRLVKFTLEQRNFEVVATSNGLAAIEIASTEKPDLILLDVMMPVINGYDTCVRLKKNEKTKDIPVIILSAKAQKKEVDRALKVGAADFIAKPFSPRELREKIEKILSIKN
ncbi:MAG TPA: response regulator [Candidatus Subteraquimicrobiales bacterium]